MIWIETGCYELNRRMTDAVLFKVSATDSGEDIAAEDLERIHRPFKRGRNIMLTENGSLRLGLPLARHLVELHGGTLRIDSTPPALTPASRSRCRVSLCTGRKPERTETTFFRAIRTPWWQRHKVSSPSGVRFFFKRHHRVFPSNGFYDGEPSFSIAIYYDNFNLKGIQLILCL